MKLDDHACNRGGGVTDHVTHGLLDDPIDQKLLLRWKSYLMAGRLEVGPDACVGYGGSEFANSGHQAQQLQGRGAQITQHSAHSPDRLFYLGLCFEQSRSCLLVW